MTPEELIGLMNELPDDMIDSANRTRFRRRGSIRYLIPAAAACLLVGIAAMLYPKLQTQKPAAVGPAETGSHAATSEIQVTSPQVSSVGMDTTTCADETYHFVSEAITTVPVQTAAVSTGTQSATTHTDSSVSDITAPAYTTSVTATETVKPPADRTTAATSENGTTTALTVDQNSYAFRISFVDDVSLKKIGNVNARLVQQRIEWVDSEHSRDVGEGSAVADWNSSDSNPYTAIFSKESGIEYRYTVIADNLPAGYSFYGKSSVEYYISGLLDEVRSIEIPLTEKEPVTATAPLYGTYSLKLKVLDIATNRTVPDLDCELYCIQTKEIAAAWNTGDTQVLSIGNLSYSFDKPDSYNGNITYALRITNLPRNYRFYYGKSREMYGICGFGLEEFANGTELNCIAYLENTGADAA